MKAIHVISDSDAPVMLGAGLYLVKAYLTAWKIVMEQKGRVGCSCGLCIWSSWKIRGPFRTSPAPSGQSSFSSRRYRCSKKLLVFLVLLTDPACWPVWPEISTASVPMCPRMGGHRGKGRMVGFVSPDREAIVTVTVAQPRMSIRQPLLRDGPRLGGAISWKKMVSTASHSGIMV